MITEIKRAFVENKMAILAALTILVLSLILGFCLEGYLYSYMNPVVEELTRKVQEGVITPTFHDIFLNNLRVICVIFVFGMILCFSALMLAFNGFFVGYYIASSSDFFAVLMYILPHGIFELPSIMLACAASFVLFNFVCKFIRALLADNSDSFRELLGNAYDKSYEKLKQAIILFAISVILMVIAGIVEAYLTIPIAQLILSIVG